MQLYKESKGNNELERLYGAGMEGGRGGNTGRDN